MRAVITSTIQLLLLLPGLVLSAEKGDAMRWHDGRFRLTYESLALPQGETLGLLGGSYLLDAGHYSYLGLGIYGAVQGERGGFFTGGFDGGLRYPLSKQLTTEAGLFVGGGGGGAAPQGGGLMLRPYLGLSWELQGASLGLQLSEVRFPNGNINSRQLGVTLSRPFSSLFAMGWLEEGGYPGQGVGVSNRRYSVIAHYYQPEAGTLNTAGEPAEQPVRLLGFEAEQALQGGRFATLATAGAGGGQSDGYAEVLAGLGWRHHLSPATAAKLQLRLGAGGGGAVDTGGGLITKLETGLEWAPSPSTLLSLNVGRMEAPDGNFSANMATIGVGYRFAAPSASSTQAAFVTPQRWQITTSRDSYRLQGTNGRKPGAIASGNVDLVSMQIDTMLSKHLLLSGTAAAAVDGGAGGYAVGLVGAGWYSKLPYTERGWVRADLQAGVAGGGGLDVGGGGLLQYKLSVGWRLSDALSLQLGWGRASAPQGSLDTELATIGITVRTTTLHGAAAHDAGQK